jgi:hypothetical protein
VFEQKGGEHLPDWRSFSRAEKALLLIFALSLPFIHPKVRSDGIGYYAYVRSLVVDHNLQFNGDWKDLASTPFIITRYKEGHPILDYVTQTGHIANHFSLGPAILWAPFLAVTHCAVLVFDRFGTNIPADGHSRPYLFAMAFSTALYGFLGLWFSFRLAREYFAERWAFLATIGVWFASSLPVYMYEDPAWSHAQSAFAVALFLWYWHRTRQNRTPSQWMVMGLIAALMCQVYFANAVLLLILPLEAFSIFHAAWRAGDRPAMMRLLRFHCVFAITAAIAFTPQLIVRKIIFGGPFALGLYGSRPWNWFSPHFLDVLFSSNRGAFLWTPILIPSVIGLVFLWRRFPAVGGKILVATAAFYFLISANPWWDGVESFGIRFFVSLTPIFILGLAAACAEFARVWGNLQGATGRVAVVFALLIVWNLGLVFQLSSNMLPIFGHIVWRDVVFNQFRVVPGEFLHSLRSRFERPPGISTNRANGSLASTP